MKEGWEYKKFEDALQKVKYTKKLQTSEFLSEGSIPIISQEEEYISGYWNKSEDSFKVDSPVVVFGDHSRVLKYVDFDFVLGADGVKILKPIDGLQAKYLYHYLKWYNVPSMGYSRHYKFLKEITLPIPSLSEQKQIVAELDLLSGAIEKQKSQLEELDELAQSIFYDMFGDPVANEKGWEKSLLGKTCVHITDGDHMPPPKSENGIPFITISDIDKNTRVVNFDNTFFVPKQYFESLKEERIAKYGDVLYTVTGSYGIPVVINFEKQFCFQRHIALLRPNKKLLDSYFLCYWVLCESVKRMADEVATGIAQKTVGLNSLRKFPIILPHLSLQQEFASKIEAIESMKAKVRQSLSEAETLFNSRMDYYFN